MFNRTLYLALKKAKERGYSKGWRERENIASEREKQLLEEITTVESRGNIARAHLAKTSSESLRTEKGRYDSELGRERARISQKLREMRERDNETKRELLRVRELLDDVKSISYFLRTVFANQKLSLQEVVRVLAGISDCKIEVEEVISKEKDFRKRLNSIEVYHAGKHLEGGNA